MTSCELNQIFLGEIAAVQNYGAFVKIPGCRQQGLIHKSQVSGSKIDDVADVLQRGERVWCKVISVDDDGKIGLSMKVVNQGNGTDLDPNGIEIQRDEQKKKSFGTTQKKVIELEAVLNTTCTKCGTKGHLANDCFVTPDGKKYELLPEIEDNQVVAELPPPIIDIQSNPDKDEKKSQSKKLKKRKKSKKSKHKLDNNVDDNLNEGERKKRKKKKKHSKETKRKKRKHSENSSGESSDSVTKEKHAKKCKHSKTKHSD